MRLEEAIAAVEHSIEEDPIESIRHRAQELGPSTLWKMLRKNLGLSWLLNTTRAKIEAKRSSSRA